MTGMPLETIDSPRTPIVDPDLPIANFVFETLGATSVCWETMSGAGVFNDRRAKQLGDELLLRITKECEER